MTSRAVTYAAALSAFVATGAFGVWSAVDSSAAVTPPPAAVRPATVQPSTEAAPAEPDAFPTSDATVTRPGSVLRPVPPLPPKPSKPHPRPSRGSCASCW
jgi:hypothetical protein